MRRWRFDEGRRALQPPVAVGEQHQARGPGVEAMSDSSTVIAEPGRLGRRARRCAHVSVVTGEGGGAVLALATADRPLMLLANMLYSVISPRCAAILWRYRLAAPEAARVRADLRVDLLRRHR